MKDDPLEDEPNPASREARRPAVPGQCREGGRCDGGEWVQVLPAYAIHLHPGPAAPVLGASDAELAAYDLAMSSVEALRRSARDSWYPCRACAPDQFFRWAGGHFAADHFRRGCGECEEAGTKRKASA